MAASNDVFWMLTIKDQLDGSNYSSQAYIMKHMYWWHRNMSPTPANMMTAGVEDDDFQCLGLAAVAPIHILQTRFVGMAEVQKHIY